MSNRRLWLCFALLLLVSCTKRALLFGVGPGPIAMDAIEYWRIAGDVAAGDWLQRTGGIDYRTPLYPTFVALHRRWLGDHSLVALVFSQHVLLLGANLITAWVCWRVSRSRWVGLLAFGFAEMSLLRDWAANVVLTEALFTFLLTAAIAALVMYHQRPSLGGAAAAAVLLGLAILVRPVPQWLGLPLVGLFFFHCSRWAVRRRAPRTIVRHALAAAAILALLLAPWCVRNWAVFGKPFLSRLPAVNKWQVCFQGASAARLPIPPGSAGERLRALVGTADGDLADRYCYAVVSALQSKGMSKEEIDALVSDVCLQAICRHPLQFAWPALKRFVNFWRCTANDPPYIHCRGVPDFAGQRTWQWVTDTSWFRKLLAQSPAHWLRWNEFYTVLVGSGTLLMIVRRRTRAAGLSLAAVFAYFAAVTAGVEIENYRYRMVLEPATIVVVVCGFAGVWEGSRSRGGGRQAQVGRVKAELPWDAERLLAGQPQAKRTPRREFSFPRCSADPRRTPKIPTESGSRG